MQDFFTQVWQMIVESKLLNILGAIAILLIGWLLALLASSRTSAAVQRLTARKSTLPDGSEVPQVSHADTLAGKVVFYLIMIFALLGCFSVLNLNAAAAPLQDFVSEVAKYAPNAAGALLLAVAAWIVAGIVRSVVRATLLRSKLNERLAAQLKAEKPEAVAEYAARTAYYTVFLFFLPAILNALKIYGITEPLQSMFEKVLGYLPNLVAALAVLVIGLVVAGIIRRAVSGLVVISRLEAFGEKAGVSKIFGNGGLAAMAGLVAYVLVAIPVVISALTALKIEALSNSVAGFFDKLLNATGDLIGAARTIFAAILAGGFVSSLVTQLVANFGLDRFLAGMGFRTGEPESTAPSVIVGKLTFLSIVVLALLAACEILGFEQLANLIRDFAAFGGNVLLGIVILLVGIWLANFAADTIRGKCHELVVTGVRVGVIALTIALAVGNMHLGDSIVQIAFALILGAVCVTAALAFGLGGREAAAKLLNAWVEKLRK